MNDEWVLNGSRIRYATREPLLIMSFSAGGTPKKICARAEVRIFARAGPKSRGAEHAVGAKLVDRIKLAKSRAGRPKKASLRGGVKCLRGGNKWRNMPSAQNMLTGSKHQIRARGHQKRQICGAGSKVCGAGIKILKDCLDYAAVPEAPTVSVYKPAEGRKP
ncbi:hypothetical protein B0H11DRAFT_1931418 [Mycena galericulata]|nr:hypothetical protein B0H11DRAFT_1931418 [Mycena galericulata]